MARTLWCSCCDAGYLSVGGDVPRQCPHCGTFTVWRTLAPMDAKTPRATWELTPNDRRFLKSLRIGVD
jgi:hypothetical protein